jgi:hypothetical protein
MSVPALLLGAGALAALALALEDSQGPLPVVPLPPSPPRQSPFPKWLQAEIDACTIRGLQHHGGPGRPDCGRTVEVKEWSRPVDAGTVRKEHAKGRRTIVARSGFTGPAREAARKLGMRLRRT